MRKKIGYFFLGLGALFFYLIKPRWKYRKKLRFFLSWPYAHRGLHGKDFPENTPSALKAAVDKGYGIEIDVRACKDRLVIHHDEDLNRSAGVDLKVEELDYESLRAYPLFGGEERILTLEAALEIIDGKVPLLLEIKSEKDHFSLGEKVQAIMDKYQGAYLIECFHPLLLLWYRLYRPKVLRGQLSSGDLEKSFIVRKAMALLLFNVLSRPDFIAYEKKGGFAPWFLHQLGTPSFAYTLLSADEKKNYFHGEIFEGYLP